MRQLFPVPVDDVDPDIAYWVPDPGRQCVTGVMISSVDGAAESGGRSGGLGDDTDRQLFALMRAQAEVILVGAATVRAERYGGDHPSPAMRAVRRSHGLPPAPRVAVLTTRADLDPEGPLFTDTEVRPLVIATELAGADRLGALAKVADVMVAGAESVDVADALDALSARGLKRVSCEGGRSVLTQVMAAGRLTELRLTLSPQLLAGSGRRITGGPVPRAFTLDLVHVLQAQDYLFLRYGVNGAPVRAAAQE